MKRIRTALAIVVVIGIAIGLWLWLRRPPTVPSGQLVLYGNVDIRQVQLAFNGSERISKILVQEGDRVESGELVAELETRRFAAKVKSREAELAAQHQALARLQAGNRPEEIRKAGADLEAARAEVHNAQLTFDRVSQLVTQDVDTQQRADDAKAALDVAKARLAAAQEAYNLMVLGPRKEDIAAAQAALEVSRANLQLARTELSDAQLFAPTNGVIQNRLLESGDMATPQTPVLTLALDDPVWVRAYIAETDLGKIHPGMKATVQTDSFAGKQYEGWIGFISPTAEFTPKTVETPEVRTRLVYQVRVMVSNPEDQLRLGMPAVVRIPLSAPAASSSNDEDSQNQKP